MQEEDVKKLMPSQLDWSKCTHFWTAAVVIMVYSNGQRSYAVLPKIALVGGERMRRLHNRRRRLTLSTRNRQPLASNFLLFFTTAHFHTQCTSPRITEAMQWLKRVAMTHMQQHKGNNTQHNAHNRVKGQTHTSPRFLPGITKCHLFHLRRGWRTRHRPL